MSWSKRSSELGVDTATPPRGPLPVTYTPFGEGRHPTTIDIKTVTEVEDLYPMLTCCHPSNDVLVLAWEGQTIGLSDDAACPYSLVMADEDTVLEEAMDNLKEAGQRIRATQSLMRSQGMTGGENYRDLLTRLSTALAMIEAAYLEAKRRRDL